MNNINKKCSFNQHKEINAIYYCQDCNIYICNKCLNIHQGFFENHHQLIVISDNKKIFINLCEEENHPLKLEYYCKNHNQLCCAACIAKINSKGNGRHKDCIVYNIEEIKEEKKNNLKDNIKNLELYSNNLENSINSLKEIFEKLKEKKEEIKLKIQNIFTKLRNRLNEREDYLLLEVDNKYNEIFYDEDIFKDYGKIQKKIKISLENGKSLDKEDWNDNKKLTSILSNCINIENHIKNICLINDNIKKYNSNNNAIIDFIYEDNDLIKKIQIFGNIGNKLNIDSEILKNENIINKFYKLISNKFEINNIKLIFRKTKDGLNNFNDFANKINNKSNLIFLFCTGNERIFGAFIKSKLENIKSSMYFEDKNAFVFSLNNNKIYNILVPKKAVRFFESSFIKIGNTKDSNGFYFEGGKINDNGLLNKPLVYDFQKNCELTEGLNQLTEFEIYEINY